MFSRSPGTSGIKRFSRPADIIDIAPVMGNQKSLPKRSKNPSTSSNDSNNDREAVKSTPSVPVSEDPSSNEYLKCPVAEVVKPKREPCILPGVIWDAKSNAVDNDKKLGKHIRVIDFELEKDCFTNGKKVDGQNIYRHTVLDD